MKLILLLSCSLGESSLRWTMNPQNALWQFKSPQTKTRKIKTMHFSASKMAGLKKVGQKMTKLDFSLSIYSVV